VDFRLRKHETISAGCQRVACEEIAAVLQDLHACAVCEDPAKPIHDARKHLKKLRALVRFVRPVIGDEAWLRETGTFRRAARRLAIARDAEVCVRTIEDLCHEAPEGLLAPLDQARAFFSEILAHHRNPAHRTLDAIGGSLVDAAASVREWEFAAGCEKTIRKGLDRIYRRARKARSKAEETPSTECLHKWRQRTKEFWALMRLFREIGGKQFGRLEKDAKELGELLGTDHDLGVLKDSLYRDREAAGIDESAFPEIERLIEERRSNLQRKAWKLGSECYREKPRRFVERFVECWEDWHKG